MERNLHNDPFERFLKDSVEDFRMYPSRRVWTSLYNNLHPGKRWPSMPVSLLLICAIIFIGFSNTNETGRQASNNQAIFSSKKSSALLAANQSNAGSLSERSEQPSLLSKQKAGSNFQDTKNTGGLIQENQTTNADARAATANLKQPSVKSNGSTAANSRKRKKSYSEGQARVGLENTAATDYAATEKSKQDAPAFSNPVEQQPLSVRTISGDGRPEPGGFAAESPSAERKAPFIAKEKSLLLTQENDRPWIDDHAFYNRRKDRNANRLSYQMYITPSIGYRTFKKNSPDPVSSNNTATGNLAQDIPHGISHSPALNLEGGYSVLYSLGKTIRLKGGVQVNYSSYRINAQLLNHPMATSMYVNDPVTGQVGTVFMASSVANVQGGEQERRFSNSSFQLSVPIGADLRLAGNNRFQWFAGATIQPTYVLSGNAYMISADMKNYVFNANFLRNWNLNAGFETFITYRVNNMVTVNAGPQFRYQFRSSFNDRYTYDEKLYNLGIKLGIIQQF